MNFDTILIHLGEFGPWQRRNNLLLWLPLIGSGVNVMVAALAVMAPRHGYRCRNSCDVTGDFTWQVPGHVPGDIFPSLDVNSSFYSPDSPDYCQPMRDLARALPTAAFRNRHNSLCYENLCHVVGLNILLIITLYQIIRWQQRWQLRK